MKYTEKASKEKICTSFIMEMLLVVFTACAFFTSDRRNYWGLGDTFRFIKLKQKNCWNTGLACVLSK